MSTTTHNVRWSIVMAAAVAGCSPIAFAGSNQGICGLLTDAEAQKLISRGQSSFSAPEVTNVGGGSLCQYTHGQIGIWKGPDSGQHVEQFLKSWKQEALPRHPVPGVGDKAYVFFPKARNEYSDQGPYLVASVRPHTITAMLFARKGQADGPMAQVCRGDQGQLDADEKKDCARVLADVGESPESLEPAVVELAKVMVAKLRSGEFVP